MVTGRTPSRFALSNCTRVGDDAHFNLLTKVMGDFRREQPDLVAYVNDARSSSVM